MMEGEFPTLSLGLLGVMNVTASLISMSRECVVEPSVIV